MAHPGSRRLSRRTPRPGWRWRRRRYQPLHGRGHDEHGRRWTRHHDHCERCVQRNGRLRWFGGVVRRGASGRRRRSELFTSVDGGQDDRDPAGHEYAVGHDRRLHDHRGKRSGKGRSRERRRVGPAAGGGHLASTGTVTLAGGATRSPVTDPLPGDGLPSWSRFTIPGGGSVSIAFTVDVAATVGATTLQNPATATYLDPARTTVSGTTSTTYDPASSTAEDVAVGWPDLTITKEPQRLLRSGRLVRVHAHGRKQRRRNLERRCHGHGRRTRRPDSDAGDGNGVDLRNRDADGDVLAFRRSRGRRRLSGGHGHGDGEPIGGRLGHEYGNRHRR